MVNEHLGTSKIFLDREAYRQNLNFIKSLLDEKTTLSSVVKGNAYGHGIQQFVEMALSEGVNHFSVYSADEAYKVFEVTGSSARIMIMGMIDDQYLEWAISNDIEFFVFDLERLYVALEIAERIQKPARIHIELETGMNRSGIEESLFDQLFAVLNKNREHYILEGLCTHYAGAENIANFVRVKKQKIRFLKNIKKFAEAGFKAKKLHTNCSAAMIRYPEMNLDLVRVGILQYGFWPSVETYIHYTGGAENYDNPLKRIISWTTRILSVKKVKAGEFIGYGMSFLAQGEMTIALVPVGYAMGYSRSLSNQGRMIVNGIRVGVIGTINMNVLTIDVTNVPNVKRGDEVVLIGKRGDLSISVSSFSEMTNELNYEMLTRLPHNIPREII